jgi:hypothetical protein
MSPRGKKRTTMAKLTRESRLRERRVEKQARKEIRRSGAESHPADARWPSASDSHPADSPPEGAGGA